MRRPLRPLLTLLAVFTVLAPAAPARPQDAADRLPLLEPLAHGRQLELPELDRAVPSPADFLGYPLGARFTHHHRILDYLEHLAEASPRVTLWSYGESYEGRPLTLVAVSSPENLERLDRIRQRHRRLADPRGLADDERRRLLEEQPAVVWLAYGVHGNESSSSEAAMAAAYALAAAGGDWPELLDGTVVLLDPVVNPDGRERYVHFYERARGRVPDPDPAASEHREPWPGGRQNHYLIDLNRDWAWATQRETRARLAEYRRWEPQVYVDYHEMFAESTYFFPPAAEPVNPHLDRRTVAWLDLFGRANAQAFDRQGWPYFKAETFDLFYPGYGDAYPAFRGAVGMTYEMAGHGRAGLVVERRDGSTLTLADRIARHATTSLATVRAAAENRRLLLDDFTSSRADAAASTGPAWLWPADAPEAGALAELLGRHGIEVARLASDTRARARRLAGPTPERDDVRPEEHTFPAGTYAVHAGQPLGNLARTLLDRTTRVPDPFVERQRERLERNVGTEFYDITAWSLPLAFNLETWVVPEPSGGLGRGEGSPGSPPPAAPAGGLAAGGDPSAGVGFLVPPAGLAGYRFASALLREGIDFRVAFESFELDGISYPSGTLFVPRLGNEAEAAAEDGGNGAGALAGRIDALAAAAGVTARSAPTFYVTRGVSLGSDRVPTVTPPRIGLLSGEGLSPTSLGSLWHLLDRQVEMPHTRLDLDSLGGIDLSDFDVLVLPDGWGYDTALEGMAGKALAAWVRDGGVLVAVGRAHRWLAAAELTAVEEWQPEEDGGERRGASGEGDGGGDDATEEEPSGEGLERRPIRTPGAILATELTAEHPLGVGLPSSPPVLVNGSTVLQPTGDPQVDVLRAVEEEPVLSGVAFEEAVGRLAGSLLASVEAQGRGAVVLFAHDPDYRLFWRGTAPLFLNAVLYGPSLGGGGY